MRAALGLMRRGDMPSWPPVRHPAQLYLMVAGIVSGGAAALAVGSPQSFAGLLSGVFVMLWGATVAVSSLCGVVAALVVKRDVVLSLLLERVALFTLAPVSLLFAVVVTWRLHWDGVYAAGYIGGYGFALAARALQVHQTIQWLHLVKTKRDEQDSEVDA